MSSHPMRTNPGGSLKPEEVVGRDGLIVDLWDKLERHSVLMTAERRMGKTSVLRKMSNQQVEGVIAFYWDLENVQSPEELVQDIFNKVSDGRSVGLGRDEFARAG
jgi:predicted AAA+ superfamily ATPase